MRSLHPALPLSLALLAFAVGCDNVGRAFDPDGGSKGGSGDTTGVEPVQVGGISIEGRPKVRAAYPRGSGWAVTVPIVVVFNESVGLDSVAPPSSSQKDPTVYLRAKGTTAPLPASYDFLLGATVVLIRPATPLGGSTGNGPAPEFEIVVDPELRDADGVRFGGSEPEVVAAFTADEATTVTSGRIVTMLPENNAADQQRETPVYMLLTKPAVATSLTDSSFQLRANGSPLPGDISTPLRANNLADTRIVRFDPDARLAGSTTHELVVTDEIRFGTDGKLDFRGRTPFSTFRTLAQAAPSAPVVGNATTGFPDQINRANLPNLAIDVPVDASAAAGDDVLVRIYGLEPKTKPADDVAFVERSRRLALGGAQTVTVDFSMALGTLAAPRFSDGNVTIATALARGSRRTGYVLSSTTNQPRLDVTPPSITAIGPPAGSATNSLVTDQEHVVLHGRASETLKTALLTAGSASATLHASDAGGSFALLPLFLGRRTGPLAYQLEVADRAGNPAAAPLTGEIEQRGVVTGTVTSGQMLTVEIYDEATLARLPGTPVLIEPGMPAKPAAGRLTATTGSDGRATFTGLPAASYSITVVRGGYHLRSLLDTPAAFVSLPLRPIANATATLGGAIGFLPSPGQSARVASNLLDDPAQLEIVPASATPTVIPSTAIRPNRLQVLSGYAGVFEPTALPGFTSFGISTSGANGQTPTPPLAPTAPGQPLSANLTLLPATGTVMNLAGTFPLDFTAATGLDTANLIGRPKVRIVTSLKGLAGMTPLGVGFATGTGPSYTIQGTYSLGAAIALTGYGPALWVSTEAVDRDGNVSRQRQLVVDYILGTTFPTVPPPGVATVTAPGGPSTGSPSVTFEDRLNPAALLGGFGFHELRASDSAGRQWSVLRADGDGAGAPETWQLPDLAGSGATGLATGSWTIGADSHLLFSATFAPGDYLLEEMRRQQVAWSRAAAKTFVVQ